MNDNFDKNPENKIWDDEEDYDCYEIAEEDRVAYDAEYKNNSFTLHGKEKHYDQSCIFRRKRV